MEEKDRLLEGHHDNDGIQEYDNPLPTWFLYLFYASIVFAALYFSYYCGHGWAMARAAGVGQNLSSSGGEYLAAVRRAEKSAGRRPTRDLEGGELLSLLKAPASVASGETVFKTNCSACHGDQGQGVVGPNLADSYWIHGGSPAAVVASISQGYPDKGMPAWRPVLGAEKARLAAAYVLSLRGRAVANPKAPQGVLEP